MLGVAKDAEQKAIKDAFRNLAMSRPFNPLAQAEPKPPRDLASAQIGGLGLKLVRSFAGSIDYQRCDATNRLTLTFPAE